MEGDDMHYLITFHETDGNDATVYDAIIEAPTKDAALDILSARIEREAASDDSRHVEADGTEFGYYYNCDDDCAEECDGHGGIALREVEEYQTAEEARKNLAAYHTRYEV